MRQFSWQHVGALGRGTMISTVGLVARAALQAVYLVVVSRWLGAEGYGLFAGSVAAAVIFTPLATGGMGLVFTDRLARSPGTAGTLWSRVASQTVLSGIAMAVAVLALVLLWLPVRLAIFDMTLLVVCELVALPLVQTATAALMAQQRVGLATMTVVAIPLLRVSAMLAILGAAIAPDVGVLVLVHCLGALVVAVWAMAAPNRVAEDPARGYANSGESRLALARAGAPYALGSWAGISYAEIDKVLVLQLLGAGQAGVYTAAYRVVSVLLVPVNALLSNALPRLFAARRDGGFARVLRAVFLAAVGYSLLGALAAAAFSALMPLVFGVGYTESSRYVLALSAWLPLAALHLIGANALLAAGAKSLRMVIEGTGLLVVAATTFVLSPRVGAMGAVTGLISAEAAMAAACWISLIQRRLATSPG